jgi:hypothetical protein
MDSKRAAIYHFTNGLQRTSVCEKEIERLICFSNDMGYDTVDVFCDARTTREEHNALDNLFSKKELYSAIITKDYFHINKYTLQVFNILKELNLCGINLYTMNDRILEVQPSAPFDKPLTAATYYCHWQKHNDLSNVVLKNDILKTFIDTNTNWILLNQYHDEEPKGHAGNQLQLQRLLEKRTDYDIVLLHSMSSLHWRTHNFINTIDRLHLDIFSLQEGYIKYMR